MTEYVRVKVDGPDHEITISKDQLDAQPDAFKVLDKDAVDNGGVPIPPKYKISLSSEGSKKTSSRVATTEAATSVDQNKEN
jgi:hypothetical protein